MDKLRVGVVLPGPRVPEWIRGMLEDIHTSPHAEVSALAFAEPSHTPSNKLYNLHFSLDRRLHRPSPDAWARSDIRKVLHNTQILGESLGERISRLKALRLDVLLNLGLDDPPPSLPETARFGLWTLRCNDARTTAFSEIGWLEVLHARPLLRLDIEIQRGGSMQIMPGSVMAAHAASFTLNQRSFFWRAAAVVPRLLKRLSIQGGEAFFARSQPASPAEPADLPTAAQQLWLGARQAARTFENKVWRRRFPHRWALLAGKYTEGEPFDWGRLRLQVPPRGAFWADPFPIKREGRTWLFFEEYLYKARLGRISVAPLDGERGLGEPQVALERPYHLSYPFLFEFRGEFYMIPETAQNRAIEVYRCARFPDRWEFHKSLMRDVQAVDTTLIEHAGRWWMFVNVAGRGGSTWDELHLFHADDPLTSAWNPHPLNPVVSDVRSARPAGRLFRRDGGLIRPSQDSSLRYGYAINLNRITKLTTAEYEEELLERIEPARGIFLAVHTYNLSEGFVAVDAMMK